jgi:3-oxoacyl-[acyl-carrier-protein] synthase II
MVGTNDIVITGLGCVSPIGIGREAFWNSLKSGKCGISLLHTIAGDPPREYYGGVVKDFDGKVYVTPRKALKVMNREVQTAYSAAHLAWQDANLIDVELNADRLGVIYGSEMFPGEVQDLTGAIQNCSIDGVMQHARWGAQFSRDIFPLWMLKNLPNMPACHVGIAINARGPNNTIVEEECSGLQALIEAAMIIQRDVADVMVVGAVGGRVEPTRLIFRLEPICRQQNAPSNTPAGEGLCTPFDLRRCGLIAAEGAASIVIERRSHAVRRGAKIYGQLTGFANRFAKPKGLYHGSRVAIGNAMTSALKMAEVEANSLAVVSAQGYSCKQLDIEESQAIATVCGEVPVTAFSSYFGSAGAACGLLELVAGVLATSSGLTLPTLGYSQPDPACPVQVTTHKERTTSDDMLKLSFTPHGHAAAVVVRCNT